ncbi:ATP-grasp domain-containing protein [Gemella sp. GH3]|uniref:5-(carboxyamino)imidazole ribonucleotide synthase n=1 Tax=unclassified Gemella TaxID=2624949 RepID=UPI0015D018B8|nr:MULTISPECIES: ATP-grasp domain-containing protein [unclassified Gemella]MBF0713765.1 ATP-grasp domain-containing protein [Gemella sp. GH3.1]NYS50717.1 ATP-grasp domain-containing protein [Gemella sp. GH3]
MMKTVLPGSTIGIIGGGQLGRMLAMSAKEMGYKIIILDPNYDCCAKIFSDKFINADFDNFEKIEELCRLSDVVTFEFENIDAKVLAILEEKYNLVQSSKLLKITQHRYLEKEFAKTLDIPTVNYIHIEKNTNICIEQPYLMKTLRFGYDGKGQKIINKKEEIEQYTILEEIVSLDKEISVIASKDKFDIQIVAVVENEHRNNILYRSKIPTSATEEQENLAVEYTKRILNNIDYYGVITVEFFISNGKVIFNEIAPRVHNSGHITMQSANKSQFRAHIEAICGLRVGNIINRETTLYNILGQDEHYFKNLITEKQGYLHLYEKEAKQNRKIGHINFYGDVYLGENDE